MGAPRSFDVWMHGKGQWEGRWPSRGGDEYGRRAIIIPLPQGRALAVAYRTCRCTDCIEMREQTARHERIEADPRTALIDDLIDEARAAGLNGPDLPGAAGLTEEQYGAWRRGDGLPDGYVPPAQPQMAGQ